MRINHNHQPVQHISQFRFYAELNDFLSSEHQQKEFGYSFLGQPSVKDTLEAIGVPHTEIDLILIDGNSVDFGYSMQGNEQVSIFPVFESFDIKPIYKLRPEPLRITKFILDVHLGTLARYLRLLGFDCYYKNHLDDDVIANIAQQEKRIVLSRDLGIFKRKQVTHGYYVRNIKPRRQLAEVVKQLQLKSSIKTFVRCARCNSLLEPVGKEEVKTVLGKDTLKYFELFKRCTGCYKVYWKGSHHEYLCALVKELPE